MSITKDTKRSYDHLKKSQYGIPLGLTREEKREFVLQRLLRNEENYGNGFEDCEGFEDIDNLDNLDNDNPSDKKSLTKKIKFKKKKVEEDS